MTTTNAQRCKKWRDANKAKAIAWQRANPDKVTAKNKRWRSKNTESAKAANTKWKKQNRLKIKAHSLLHTEVRAGRIVKQPCEVCGKRRVEAHHDDYTKPLDVRWLCKKHHMELHRFSSSTTTALTATDKG
jgi:hypothetical protein